MILVEVIPISRAINKESLSYFTGKDVEIGSIVNVPLRKKSIKALIVSCNKVSSLKTEIRSNEYAIKKVIDLKPTNIFLTEFIEATQELSEHGVSSTGSSLHSLIPKVFLESYEKIVIKNLEKNKGDIHEKYVIQCGEEERFSHYKSIVRENVAKGKSVFFVAPTAKLAEGSFNSLKKGISEYCYLIHSSLGKKELIKRINDVLSSPRPVIVITTHKYLAIPRNDIGAIILDRENSNYYKAKSRPFTDARVFAEYFSKKIKAKLFLGDLSLRTETIWRAKEGELVEFIPMKQKVAISSGDIFVDMKGKSENPKDFKVVSPELEKLLKEAVSEKKKIFLFATRKGLHPLTLCGDCGELVKCERCSSPIVLHSLAKKNFFLCHKCGRQREAETRCAKCHSWKLVSLGIGIEYLEKKLKENFKDTKIFRIDGDITPTPKKAEEVWSNFKLESGGILLGTEMALNYLEPLPFTAVVSMDSLFSIPDFRINEKIVSLVFSIKEKALERFLMQTRNIDNEVMGFITKGNLADFYKEEIKQREEFNFPPFNHFIKISFSGSLEGVNKEGQKLKDFFDGYDVSVYPGFVSELKGRNIKNVLIKIPKEKWPDEKLREKVLSLPQKFSVDFNPDNLL